MRVPHPQQPGHDRPKRRRVGRTVIVTSAGGALGLVALIGSLSPHEPPAATLADPTPGLAPQPGPRREAIGGGEAGRVTEVVDGDTIDVRGYGTIRVIGIDAPERGECGHARAGELMQALTLGKRVTLVAGARDDRDRYGRLLRYVDVDGRDAGLVLIRRGLAVARYDSRDGYGAHPRERRYVAADAASPDRTRSFCAVPPVPPPRPQGQAAGPEPWNQPGPDLDCSDIGRAVVITGPDYHGLDSDGDGIGCDSYG
jgi:endonuclease YncB( thermonuclease family)